MDNKTDKNKLFIGGIPWSITSEALKELFASYGEITEAIIINDRDTGRSKGFGFVTFVNEDDAQKALEMDGKEVEGRNIMVNLAKPRENKDNFRGENNRFGGNRRNY
ncbi:RNA-binding protein [Candidatus Woesebacteria bacterium]|nr:RNA-binding protein [Candidatus Woesebacteria bacterium]